MPTYSLHSSKHAEIAELPGRSLFSYRNIVNPRKRRPFPTPVRECRKRIRLAFGNHAKGTVALVPRKSGKAESLGANTGTVAEENPLHAADDMELKPLHRGCRH